MITFTDLLINILNTGFMIYTLYLFFDYFSDGRIAIIKQLILIIVVGITSVFFLSCVPMGGVRTLLFISMPIILSFVFKLKWFNHFLLSLLIFALECICEFATTVAFSLFFNVNTQVAVQGIYQVLGIVLSKMILLLILIILRISRYKLSYSLTPTKIFALLLLPLSTIFISFVHINWFVQYPTESQSLTLTSFFSYFILILSNIIVFHLIDRSYKDDEKDKQLSTVTELLAAQSERYEQMQEHNLEILKIRHDQKNFVLGLLTEINNNNITGIKESLLSEYQILSQPNELETKNSIISTVVKTKSEYAKLRNIVVDFQYSELYKLNISAVDIAIILGNALDNAIEATEQVPIEKRCINIIAKVSQNMVVIVIRNPTKESIDTQNLKSTKRNDGSPGFGIPSMKKLAKKHDGEIILTCEDGIFETNIIVRNTHE